MSQDNEKQGGREKSKLYLTVRELLQGAGGGGGRRGEEAEEKLTPLHPSPFFSNSSRISVRVVFAVP